LVETAMRAGLMRVAAALLIAALFLAGCARSPQPQRVAADPTTEPAYANAVKQLTALGQQADDLLKRGLHDQAAAAIGKGQPLQAKLLAAPHPTLAAMEAVSNLDDLYARMLFANRHDVWARTLYEKNVARWKLWKPQTEETKRRLRQAEDGVAACDRRLAQ
jgi:hypothetical protein